ncbi:hypothetical protein ASF17_01830 [Frigoribacterium sp. Leaf263]|uniref:hypothetical protein n=1 Tax=Frigoribacterium sp. Leaf263 TaxID=1736313 RepID=UPI0006FB0B16|nr:hypothetical protein [Frigoribacterium sp. Leaf263]KQO84288.1 hypothetical protein ASF17_01830 [Frigoribacterium sp. Leaf263]
MATKTKAEAADESDGAEPREELRSCFVVAPIGAEGSETRRRSDQVLRHVIDPVIAELGFAKAVRADKISDGGLITRQVIDQIYSADLVVADLTGNNPNVFYELALRHTFGKPFVQVAVGTVQEPLPFDVADQRTIFFDHKDLDAVEAAKDALRDFISAIMAPGAVVESPVSYTMDVMQLRSSSNPDDRNQASMMEMLEDLRSMMIRSNRGVPVHNASHHDVVVLRRSIEELLRSGRMPNSELIAMMTDATSSDHNEWIASLQGRVPLSGRPGKAPNLATVTAANARAAETLAALEARHQTFHFAAGTSDPV